MTARTRSASGGARVTRARPEGSARPAPVRRTTPTADDDMRRRSRRCGGLVVAATVIGLSGCGLRGAMAPRGVEADIANGLWWYMLWLSTAIFVGWLALFGVGLVRRHRTVSDATDARIHRRFIVGGGLVLPVIVLGSLFVANLGALRALPSDDDAVI